MEDAWYWYANCRGVDPEIFYTHAGAKYSNKIQGIAIKTCADCPVVAECLTACLAEETALTVRLTTRQEIARYIWGYRGGLTSMQRVKIILAQRLATDLESATI